MVTFITFLSFIPIIVPIGGNAFTLGDLAAALLLIYYTALNITFAVRLFLFRQELLSSPQP